VTTLLCSSHHLCHASAPSRKFFSFEKTKFQNLEFCVCLWTSKYHPDKQLQFHSQVHNYLPLSPGIIIQILLTGVRTFHWVQIGRTCEDIKTIHLKWSFPQFSGPLCVIMHWYDEEKFDADRRVNLHQWKRKQAWRLTEIGNESCSPELFWFDLEIFFKFDFRHFRHDCSTVYLIIKTIS